MLTSILIFAIFGCVFSFASMIFDVFIHLDTKVLESGVGNRVVESEERIAIMQKQTFDKLKETAQFVEKVKKDLAHEMKTHASVCQTVSKESIEENVKTLAESNQLVASHMGMYSAVIESQERLIEAVQTLAGSQASGRRRA
jgi:hypothetical protein